MKLPVTYVLARFAAAFALMSISLAAAMAQDGAAPSVQDRADEVKLDAKVSISRSSTTLAKVLEELSSKTGLSFAATDAVKDRHMTLEIVDMPVRDLLGVVTAGYDWRWYKQQPGRFVIDRRVFRAPSDPRAIPAMMQSALPVDMRVFLKVPDLKTKNPDIRTMNAALPVMDTAANKSMRRLRESLTSAFLKTDSITVRDLTDGQRRDLVAWLVFDRMRHTIEIIHDDDGPHRYDPSQFVLEYHDQILRALTGPSIKPGLGFGTGLFFADGRPVPVDYGRPMP